MGRGHRLVVVHAARMLVIRVVASGVSGDAGDHHGRLYGESLDGDICGRRFLFGGILFVLLLPD